MGDGLAGRAGEVDADKAGGTALFGGIAVGGTGWGCGGREDVDADVEADRDSVFGGLPLPSSLGGNSVAFGGLDFFSLTSVDIIPRLGAGFG